LIPGGAVGEKEVMNDDNQSVAENIPPSKCLFAFVSVCFPLLRRSWPIVTPDHARETASPISLSSSARKGSFRIRHGSDPSLLSFSIAVAPQGRICGRRVWLGRSRKSQSLLPEPHLYYLASVTIDHIGRLAINGCYMSGSQLDLDRPLSRRPSLSLFRLLSPGDVPGAN